mgnify:CR=1 FL=1
MNIRSAFHTMLSERGISKKLGIDKRKASYYKRRIEENLPVAYEIMVELLIKAGWKDNGWEK